MNKLILLLSLILSVSLFSCDNDKKDDPTLPIEQRTIDLGLSVKWASCNAGASSPEGYGEYYNWEAACKFNLPTQAQMDELINECTVEVTTLNGVSGQKLIGPNGNSIFMPCAGSTLDDQGETGFYWSSTIYPLSADHSFILLLFNDGQRDVEAYPNDNDNEYCVRTVSEK